MYDELVKMLRVCGDSNNSCGNCPVRENDGSCPHGEWEFAAEKYMLQAADAIEEMSLIAESNERSAARWAETAGKAVEQIPQWIPVTERLPDAGQIVLVYGKKGGIYTAEHNRNAMWPGSFWKLNSKSHHCEPTHWMPLPEPPKEEN